MAKEFNGLNNTAIINKLIINLKTFDFSDIQNVNIPMPCARKIITQIRNTFHATISSISTLKIPDKTIVAKAPVNTQIVYIGA